MDFFSTLFTSSTTTASATAVAGATTPGLTVSLPVAGAGTQALSFLNASANTLGIISGIVGAKAQSDALLISSQAEQHAARIEELKGKQEANDIRERLLRTLAQNNAATGASGIDVGSGTIQTGLAQATTQAERELSISRFDARIAADARRGRARILQSDAAAARYGGLARAGFDIAGVSERRRARGTV